MTASNAIETAEQQLLVEKIEVASEIVRSSQAAVAFQRVFYLEILTFERIEKEIADFILKVDRIQSKLAELFNELQQTDHQVGAQRASSIAEKLDTLKSSVRDLRKRTAQGKMKRELKSNLLNEVLPEINLATEITMYGDVKMVRAPNLTSFVTDQDFHLAEDFSEEWGVLKKKLENYLLRYVEDMTSLKVEVFGATYGTDSSNQNLPDCSRSLITKISGLIHSRRGASTSRDDNEGSNKRVHSSSRSESFFYCSNPNSTNCQKVPLVDN